MAGQTALGCLGALANRRRFNPEESLTKLQGQLGPDLKSLVVAEAPSIRNALVHGHYELQLNTGEIVYWNQSKQTIRGQGSPAVPVGVCSLQPMGKKALQAKRATVRKIREAPLTDVESALLANAIYHGSPHHKRTPGDFNLVPPAAPRPDKTLCDEAGVTHRAQAEALFRLALDHQLVSEATTPEGFPKQLWALDDEGRVFEAMHGGVHPGYYHGYPIRRSDPLHDQVVRAWRRN